MSRMSRLCLVVLAAVGLLMPACDRFSGGGDEEKKEKEQKEEKEQKAEGEEQADTGEKQAEKDEDAGDYSREDFIKASADLSCIDTKLGEDKVEDMEEVKKNVLGQYGLDSETFEKAEEKWSDDEEVSTGVEKQLEKCSEADARKLAGLEKKPEPDPTPSATGTFKASLSNEAGFDRASLTLNVGKDFDAYGQFKGKREGKGFRISFDGKVAENNSLEASGSQGKNRVSVTGNLTDSGANVEVSGSIWDRNFTTTMNLR